MMDYTEAQLEVLDFMDTREDALCLTTWPTGRHMVSLSSWQYPLTGTITLDWLDSQVDAGVLELQSGLAYEGTTYALYCITETGKRVLEAADRE